MRSVCCLAVNAELMQALDSLERQTVRPNKIYINLPYKSKRTGAEYVVPSYLSRYEDVEVLRSEDDGR